MESLDCIVKKKNPNFCIPVFAASCLCKQAIGKEQKRSKEAVSGEDLSEEDTVGAHFASTGLVHRLCRACHPSKITWQSLKSIVSLRNIH